MRKYRILLIILAFIAICINVFGQGKEPFQVKITGKGNKTIVFIPGFASSGDVWDATRTLFEKDHTCYTFTMAGFAGVPAQGEATFKSWEKAIVTYIINHKISKPVIVGHSMGGGLALAIAADYPDLPSQIVVVDALPCLAAMMDPSFKSKDTLDCSSSIVRFKSLADDQFYQMQKRTMPTLMADTAHLAQVVGWSVKSDRATFAGMFCDFSNTDLRQKISTIKCPALILLESYFVNFKPAIAEEYKNLKTGNYQYASKGLHFIMYDDKEWYDAQLKNFIK